MAASPDLVAWDACTWIALVQKEKTRDDSGKVIEDRERLCRTVIGAAEKGALQIASSAFCLAEVCKERIDDYFDHDWIVPVNVDTRSGKIACDLMRAGYSGLKPPDAIHLSAALVANVKALHTFDKRLLDLDGLIDMPSGGKLRICKPSLPGKEPPILAAIRKGAEK